MPDSIRDGAGRGYLARVNAENRLMISGPTVSQEHYTNFVYQDSYNVIFDKTPTAAGDIFLYLKNTGDNAIVLEGFSIRAASDEIIRPKLGVLGDPVGGTDTDPVNLTARSSNEAQGVFQQGVDITGAHGGKYIGDYYIAGSNDSKFRNFDADIVLPKNQALYFEVVTGAIQLTGFVVMWHDHSEAV